jgi:hypothetical protein
MRLLLRFVSPIRSTMRGRGVRPGSIIGHMIRTLWEKLRSLFDDGGASERMTNEREGNQEEAEELTPGHSDRAGQIGMFS